MESQQMKGILQVIEVPDHLTVIMEKLYEGQEATGRTGHGTTDFFQFGD